MSICPLATAACNGKNPVTGQAQDGSVRRFGKRYVNVLDDTVDLRRGWGGRDDRTLISC